jgi:DNA polymerase
MRDKTDLSPEEHPAVQAIDAAIEAITLLRESGVKTMPIDVHVWSEFCKPAPRPVTPQPQTQTPPPTLAAQPVSIPEPSHVARAPKAHPTPEHLQAAAQLLDHEINACQLCTLACSHRCSPQGTRFAPKVLVINGAYLLGDRPEAMGSRLEGPAGEMLWKMLGAIHLTVNDTYLTHAIRCPVTGRPPKEAMLRCNEWLKREIRLLRPQAILLLGPYAGATLFPTASAVSLAVGKWLLFENIPCLNLHHPMRLQMLDEALARPLKMENWQALKSLQQRLAHL